MNDHFRTTREAFEERFINAETNYQRYLVLKDVLYWVEDLQELNERKSAEIEGLRKCIKGYDLSDYTD